MLAKRLIPVVLVLFVGIGVTMMIRANRRKPTLQEKVIEPVEGAAELGREALQEAVEQTRSTARKVITNLRHTIEHAREAAEDRMKEASQN